MQRSLAFLAALLPTAFLALHAETAAPERPVKKFQAGSALYMDQVLATRKPPEKFLSFYLTPAERLHWFEHNAYYALTTSDEYVWCYSEQMNWWQDKLPEGAEAALRSARTKLANGQPL